MHINKGQLIPGALYLSTASPVRASYTAPIRATPATSLLDAGSDSGVALYSVT